MLSHKLRRRTKTVCEEGQTKHFLVVTLNYILITTFKVNVTSSELYKTIRKK